MKFNWDNKLFVTLNKFIDCMALSALWVLCCLPLFTFGASTSALYYAVHKSIRGNRGYMTKNFFHAFAKGFKQSTLSWLILLAVQIVFGLDAYITYQTLKAGGAMGNLFYFFLVMIAITLIWEGFLFPYAARFEDGIKITLKNSFIIMFVNLKWALLVFVLLLLAALAIYIFPILVFFVPALLFVFYDMIMEPLYRKYMKPEDLEREKENDYLDYLER